MGCSSSTNTAVQPMTPEDEDETGSKGDGRGDSAVSKGTTDSGVMMENRDISVLPGVVPSKLPPLTSEWVRERDADSITPDELLQQESTLQERPKSSEILEELLSQGIIPVGQTREEGSGAGEAYSIMLDEGDGVKRRPPARLESLKAKKVQSLPSKEDIEEKIRLAEERRKIKEDELKTRLRAKSARVRGPAPASSVEDDEDAALTPVEQLLSPIAPNPLDPLPRSQITRQAAEGGEWVREAGGDSREDMGGADKRKGRREKGGERGDNRGEGAERVSEDGDGKEEEEEEEEEEEDEEEEEEEELTQVEELKEDQLLTASGELESDSSFQHAEDKEEIF